jgi:hypothetical protein
MHRALAALVLLPSLLPAQHDAAPATPATRWLVTFRERPFDLEPLRAAIAQRVAATAVDAIVRDLEARAAADQAELARFVGDLGGRVTARWWIVNGCAVEIPTDAVARVAAHPRVQALHPDGVAFPSGTPLPLDRATNSANHNADAVHAAGFRGAGVTVAIIDEGLDLDMNGTGRPHATYFIDGDVNNRTGPGLSGSRLLGVTQVGAMPPDDIGGHGTGVSGVVAGEKWNAAPSSDRGHAPRANVAGYSIADFPNGGASFSTIISAWQRLLADRARLNIVAANNSYGGSPDPTHLSQQALDAAALVGDILVAVAAGNDPTSTAGSQSCANGIVAGAVEVNTRVVSPTSSRGPLSGDAGRFYPDICANGIGVACPLRNDERDGLWYSGCCTSFASPQVCGAAALYRSVRAGASALETKAALLATAEDVAAKNPNPPYNTRNAYGLGYLRDDRLIDLARGGGLLATVSLTPSNMTQTLTMRVEANRTYAAAIAWHRHVLAATTWSNLALTVRQGMQVLATSNDPRNLYEKVTFTPAQAGDVAIEVAAATLEVAAVDVALAAAPTVQPFSVGTVAAYGAGCNGTGAAHSVVAVAPAAAAGGFGSSFQGAPLGTNRSRYQQAVRADQLPNDLFVSGIAFRPDEGRPAEQFFNTNAWIELELSLGYTASTPALMSTTFDNNPAGPMTRVLDRQVVRLPDPPGVSTRPDNWYYRIVFDRPFAYVASPQLHLLLETKKTAHSLSSLETERNLDSWLGPLGETASVLANDPDATTGSRSLRGAILALLSPMSPAVPTLAASDRPSIGNGYAVRLAQARPAAPALLFTGVSDSAWNGLMLPADLGMFGAPGCAILASGEVILTGVTDGLGQGAFSVRLPVSSALVSRPLFHQGTVLDQGANAFGVATSAGVRMTVGG